MHAATVNPRCPLACGAPAARELGKRNGYRIARCPGCAHLFVVDLPSEAVLEQQYLGYSYERKGLKSVSQVTLGRLDQVLAGLERYRRNNRLLDVGFGAGATLLAAQRRGWTVHGIERSKLATEQALANGFSHVVEGDFLDEGYAPDPFDVIVMTELVEHLVSPRPFLERAYRLLRPGGVLYLTTPNGFGISGRLLATGWSAVSPPEHLNLFSPRSLGDLLRGCGFAPVHVRTEAVNPYELINGVRKRFTPPPDAVAPGTPPAPRKGPSNIALNERLHSSRTGTMGKSLVNSLLRFSNLGDSLKVRAERPSSSS